MTRDDLMGQFSEQTLLILLKVSMYWQFPISSKQCRHNLLETAQGHLADAVEILKIAFSPEARHLEAQQCQLLGLNFLKAA